MFNDWRLKKGPLMPRSKSINDGLSVKSIKSELSDSDDLIVKEISVIGNKKITIVGIDGLINSILLDQNVIGPLIKLKDKNLTKCDNKLSMQYIFKQIEDGAIPHIEMEIVYKMEDILSQVLAGCVCVLLSDIKDKAIIFDVKGYEKRTVSEPTNENIIKGSKEAFNETLRDNTAIIRRRVRSKDLKIREFDVGSKSNTKVAVVYMEGVTDKKILDEIIRRIKKMDTSSIIAPAAFEEQLLDDNKSIFPSMLYTERVDKLTSNIIEGEIAIIIDGLSIVYTVPAVFNMFFQVPEDYSFNYFISSILRFMRYVASFITIFTPGFYVAIATFHPEMLPTELSLSIIKSKQGVPFTTILEVIFMLIAFEMLIEAGERLPKLIGQTISIVGGLIVGEAAVNAKFTSPAVVVVVAIAGITGFLVPNQDLANSFRIIRLVLVVVGGMMGLYGVALEIVLTLYYLASKESFGVPYLVPFTSNSFKNLNKDTFVRGIMSNNE